VHRITPPLLSCGPLALDAGEEREVVGATARKQGAGVTDPAVT